MNLRDVHKIYFIGIGGIGMSALARYFHAQDIQVSGYDRVHSVMTNTLENLGIQINYIDEISSIDSTFLEDKKTLVVYTPAIPKDHKQFNYFKDRGFAVLKTSRDIG